MEMSNTCAIHYTNDLYAISWIWINIVSFIILISFISTGVYIVYHYNDRRERMRMTLSERERERDRALCDIQECNEHEM